MIGAAMPRLAALLSLVLLGALAGCGGSGSSDEVVAPAGAPYSYTVPDGFEATSPTAPPGQRFLTTVVPSGTHRQGYLGVYQWPLGKAEHAYSTAQLLSWLDRQTLAFYRGEGAKVAPGTKRGVADHDAICWQIHGFRNRFEGRVDAVSCALVSGHTAVEQSCVWKPLTRSVILRGCRELVATLTVD